jgi:hypothetical protein
VKIMNIKSVFLTQLPADAQGHTMNGKPRVFSAEPDVSEPRFYKVLEPSEFQHKWGSVKKGYCVQVKGPCRELSDSEYVEVLAQAQSAGEKVDEWHIAAARLRAGIS